MKKLLSTKEVAEFLGVNEKMVYSLVSEKDLPASKVTGKWIFPLHLVEQWVETNTLNYPKARQELPPYDGLLIITGSNDLLLDKTIALFNRNASGDIAVFANLGSIGGLQENEFKETAKSIQGYDVSSSGKIVYPQETSE